MKVSQLISILQGLDQDRNIYLGYDRFQLQEPEVSTFKESDLVDFHVNTDFDFLSDTPTVGDYFFDAY